ncbi:hypothetical protein ACIQ9P_38835 [Kitasatospora sp. NPDC094019]|uniref:hypothetical protein n=1 Tax=Kitasatospora sp. NPDC094019 TaxID=3364091 RepID=UPI0037F40497
MIWGSGGPVRLPDGMFAPSPGSGSGLCCRAAEPGSTLWAPVVRAAEPGPAFAVLVVEADGRTHGDLAAVALAGGFAPAVGEPPLTDAVVEIRDGAPVRLRLAGGRTLREPAHEVRVPPGWAAAAAGRQSVLVLVVPPGTLIPDPAALDPDGTAGPALHGTAAVDDGPVTVT